MHTSETGPRFTSVVAHPRSRAGDHYRAGRGSATRSFTLPTRPDNNLKFFGGKTIERLAFTNIYLGEVGAWDSDDIARIDRALAGAMQDPQLNNVIAQYYPDDKATSAFAPSRTLQQPLPSVVYRDTVEQLVAALDGENGLSGFELPATVFCFLLPRGTVLVDGDSSGKGQDTSARGDSDGDAANLAASEHDEAVDSQHGLGGYHGSIHAKRGSNDETVYYAVGVYSEGDNGIVAFDQPWKNVCATFYHELCEARTDPDVEDAIRAGDNPNANNLLGWYSPRGGEIGDIPIEEAGDKLGTVMQEVPLSDGSGPVPIQLMWSNAVAAPEGPIAQPHTPAARTPVPA
jgi:hypothetical protein